MKMNEENIGKKFIIERAHVLSGDEVLVELKTNSSLGLSPVQILESMKENGSNSIPAGRKTTNLERLWAQINSTLIYILMAGSAVSFGFNHILDGAFILGVVFINVGLGYFMESKAENATEVLKSMMSPSAQVLRNGDRQTVDADGLVVGDIFFLQPGDIVPADGRVLKAVDLSVLESPLTGEAHAILKTHLPIARQDAPLAEMKCMVYSGTQVLKGTSTCHPARWARSVACW
jgi:magnesium-transporting ATPase (P-type)